MTGYLGKQTNLPEDTVGSMAQAERDTIWGPIPGEIVSYDAAKGTATVRPLYKPKVVGQTLTMPDLFEVPVDQPRTGNAGLTMPIPAGTKVMLTPQMRALDEYEEGNEGTPYDARSFHVSNMRASLSGGDSLSDPLPNADADNTHLRFSPDGEFGIKGSPDGKIKIDGAEGNIYDLLATAIELIASDGLNILSGSSAGNGIHELENKAALTEIAGKLRAMAL
ncbi:Gp138 family membrane-puncturing spike protein [Hoeflea alexandrii]|uniref:Phage protein Gp138 N-terminal domain-containing protein n=1 Tax=Hoeflea alexandrii TaxID=288436 RepID=A0ABT1CMC8_9HYPH|nr:Gp138 family membrane-puncturing spike protein [Hoeflea alexandrii]MCO6407370.1 hypothetical protein [Hoeflea alexandrii]